MSDSNFDIRRISEYFRSGGDANEEAYVNRIFSDPKHEKDLRKHLSAQFSAMDREEAPDGVDLEAILHRVHYEINCRARSSGRKKNWLPVWISGAAAAILIPLAVWWGLSVEKQARLNRETWVEIASPAWSRTRFSLPDGTTGWLNSQSKLKYRGDYLADRKVFLTGEAFMDVSHNPARPFRVMASDIEIQVLGTRFNVASYENEQTVEVVLEEGSLNLFVPANGKNLRLSPNDHVSYEKGSGSMNRESVNPLKYIAWTEGKLVFRNDPIDVIARQLERWYNVEVELKIDNPEDLRWRATFADESLEEVLKLLKRSLGVGFRIEKREILGDDTVPQQKVILTNTSK